MRRIKVLRIITRMNIGGPARQAVLLSSELSKKGFDCALLAGSLPENEGDMTYIADESGVKPIIIPEMGRGLSVFGDFLGFLKVYSAIMRERPHIVHTHTAKAGAIGRMAARMAGVPVVIHTFHGHVFHSYFNPLKTKIFIAIEKFLAFMTDKIIAISERQKEEIRKYLAIGGDGKLALVPLGFDLEKFMLDKDESVLRRELGIPDGFLVVGIVGRLTAVKNHEMFLRVAAELKRRDEGRKVKFIIAGDGELKAGLVKLSRDLGLGGDVIFAGWRKDIDALYRIMDIVALTSFNEGTPVAIIEALASARPVVAVDAGGVRDIIEDGKTGFVVPRADAAIFVSRLAILLDNKDKREKFGICGREYARRRHSKEQLVDAIAALYNSEISRKRS